MVNPEQAWESALGQLQQDLPRIHFETWVRPARLLSFAEGTFTLGVGNEYARDWLADRLSTTIERMLIGLVNGPVRVRFAVCPELSTLDEQSEESQFTPTEEPLDVVQLEELRLSLYDLFVRANREVLIPGYLARWIPYLGPTLFWIMVGFRQIMYLKTSQEPNPGQTFEARASEIIRWTGQSRSTFWTALKEPMLGWFLSKGPAGWTHDEKTGRAKQKANHYRFVATTPLTPGDAEALLGWLQAAGAQADPLAALQAALQTAPGEIFPDPPPAPAEEHLNMLPAPRSVQNVVMLACGKTSKAERATLAQLADDLSEHLMPSRDRLFVSWYFLQHWVPRLGAAPAAMVALLRDRCYFSKDETRDQVWVHGGDAEVARWLGLPRPKTVNEWLPPIFERPARPPNNAKRRKAWEARRERREEKRHLVGHFIERTDYRPEGQSYAWQFRVRPHEPLTPEHQDLYDILLEMLCEYAASGDREALDEILIGTPTKARSGLSKAEQGRDLDTSRRETDSQNGNYGAFWTRKSEGNGANETLETEFEGAKRTQTKARAGLNLNHLVKTTIGIKPLEKFINLLEQQTTPTTAAPQNGSEPGERSEKDVVVGEWDLEKILLSGGLSSEKTASILAEMLADPEAAPHFLGWVIYGYAYRSGSGRSGIDAPVIYAANRYARAAPAPEYVALAQKAPAELLEMLEARFTRLTTPVEERLLGLLEGSGFAELIRQTCRKR